MNSSDWSAIEQRDATHRADSEGRIRTNQTAKVEWDLAAWLESQDSSVKIEWLAQKIRSGAWRSMPAKRTR